MTSLRLPLSLATRITILLAACASTAFGQLQVSIIDPDLPDGSNETVLGMLPDVPLTYDLGDHAIGTPKTYLIKLLNPGTAGIDVTQFSAGGGGFVLNNFSLPRTIAPGKFARAELIFTPQLLASYSANLQINGSSILLLARGVAGPELSILEGCTATGDHAIGFSDLTAGESATCRLSLHLPDGQSPGSPVVIHTLSIASTVLIGPLNQSAPLPATLTSTDSLTFEIRFAPSEPGVYSANLLVNNVAYSVKGTALAVQLPQPIFEWGSDPLASGQQRRLTIRLPKPAPINASGTLTMSFQPGSRWLDDDPTVRLLYGTPRSIPFHVDAGATNLFLGNAREIFFQTGASMGTIRFDLTGVPGGFAGGDASQELTIPPQPIVIDQTDTSRRAGGLDLHMIGFDNTYTAGMIAFTFQDDSGNVVGNGPMQFDFSQDFLNYYTSPSDQAGGAFDVLFRFPVSGDINQVRNVSVEFKNSAGSTSTGAIEFP